MNVDDTQHCPQIGRGFRSCNIRKEDSLLSTCIHIVKNEWKTLLRGRWIIGYGLIFLLLTDTLLRFGNEGPKVLLSLSNMMLLFIPLVGMMYGLLYLYQSREFIELLLAQPVSRKALYRGLFAGIAIPLTVVFISGAGLPLVWHGVFGWESVLVLGLGGLLTLIFTGLGFLIGLAFFEDRIRGFGLSIVIWLFITVLYDGLLLMFIYIFGDYPLERFILTVSLINPVDLARIMVLLTFDISALMGYTGAVFSRFFGNGYGVMIASSLLMLWLALPLWSGHRLFLKKDF